MGQGKTSETSEAAGGCAPALVALGLGLGAAAAYIRGLLTR